MVWCVSSHLSVNTINLSVPLAVTVPLRTATVALIEHLRGTILQMRNRELGCLVHRLLRGNALRFGIYCGVASVLIDLDHIPCFLQGRTDEACRVLHPLVLIIALIIGACVGGLVCWSILNKRKERDEHS